MGLHFSRLALAVALAMQLAAPLHAAEQLDEFYIEIKGPDKTEVSPLVPASSQPLATPIEQKPAEAKPFVKPVPKKSTLKVGVPQPFLATESAIVAVVDDGASAGVYGPVKSSDTLWSIAQQVRPSSQVSIHQTLLAIYRKNPQAFAGGRLSGLYKGARLNLPTQAQIQSESEAQAQQVVRRDGMALPARTSSTSGRVIKLSPKAESPVDTAAVTTPVAKPVVKLTPEKPGIAAAEPAPVVSSASTSSDVATTAVVAPAVSAADVISDKVVIASTQAAVVSSASPASDVDAAVTALVDQSSSAAPTAPAEPALQDEYKGKIDELSKANGQLESQVSKLTQDVAELKTLLEAKVAAPVEPVVSAADAAPAAQAHSGFWSQLVSTPLNLVLILLIPFLLALALVSLWWMARSKRDQAARELEDAESTDLLMAQGDSHFDHLLAADMVAISDLPDLEQRDETLQPQPEIILDDRKEPAFTIPGSFALSESASGRDLSDSELVPDLGSEPRVGNLGLDEDLDLDLSVSAPESKPSVSEPDWGASEPLDESEFLSALGVNEIQTQPVATDLSSNAAAPLMPEPVVVADDEFVPRENLNLSNDELDALFSSMDELESDPSFVNLEGSDDSEAEIEVLESEPVSASEEEINLKNSLASLDLQASPDATEAPTADWYNEKAAEPLNAPVDLDDIDALLAQSAPAAKPKPSFKEIDELLAEADLATESDEPYQGLSLDVGLDEFPEVLPEGDSVDVDADGELGAKLDLARAYLEIDDKSSAIELLNEVMANGTSQQKDDAQRLLKRLA